jgi:protein O-mannosyl-transferase
VKADDNQASGTRPAGFNLAAALRALAVVCMGVAAYWNSIGNPLMLDDRVSIAENAAIRDWTDVGRVWAPGRESPVAGRPVVALTLALNYAVAGVDPATFRVTNLAIHLMCALVLMALVRRTLAVSTAFSADDADATDVAWAVALVWAVHPLNSEVVNYLTQRTESMMALFLFVTLYASVRAHRSTVPRRWQAAAVATCLVGMACKESMVVAPVLVVLCDAWLVYPSPGTAMRARAGFYAALAATWGGLAALNWQGPRSLSAGFGTAVGPSQYLLNQFPIVVDYVRLSLWPRGLVAMYGEPVALTPGDVWLSCVAVLVLATATLAALWRRSWLGVAGAWFFIALAPASSIVPIATEVGAERRMYVPLVAIVCVAIWVGGRALRTLTSSGTARHLALGAVTLLLLSATVVRNAEYANPRVLAQTVLDRRPSAYGRHMLAEALIAEGRVEEAIPLLRQATHGSPRAHYALGVVYFNQQQHRAAFTELDAFVKREPLLREVVTARVIMGRALALDGRWSDAIDQFREALRIQPSHAEAPALLAQALFAAEDYDGAIKVYTTHLDRVPKDLEARVNLGKALLAANRTDDGLGVLRRGVELDPSHGASRVALATALFDLRQPEAALPHAQHAITLEPSNPQHYEFLGRVLAVMGRFDEARRAFERALLLDAGYESARDNLARLDQFLRSQRSRR